MTATVDDVRAWCRWEGGDAHPLSEPTRATLEAMLGLSRRDTLPVSLDEVRLAESALPSPAAAAMSAVVGAEHVRADRMARILHCRGRSTVDLLRLRSGDASGAPDAVVLPSTHDEVLAILRICSDHGVAVVPYGGGTSVVGGVDAVRDGFDAVVSLDLRRMDRVVAVDEVSATATFEPGLRAPRVEARLGAHGLTLGHFPQSYEQASIGGFAATRSAGQASTGYGRFDDMVVSLRAATPVGTLTLGRAPASAAGPDLRQLVLGSEGTLGLITEVTLRVRRAPEVQHYEGWSFADFASGVDALRRLAQADWPAATLRLSDETETAINRGLDGTDSSGRCILVAGFEGSGSDVELQRTRAAVVLATAGGTPLGTAPGESWMRGRYRAPSVRDSLLDIGVLAETLETATSWSGLHSLHGAVRDALDSTLREQGTPSLIGCHVSHVYPTGASLYFTVVVAQADDPIAQWLCAKRAASEAIVGCGATITHHHAVGIDHRDWMAAEIGEIGVDILRTVKHTLDPKGILNPGKLIP